MKRLKQGAAKAPPPKVFLVDGHESHRHGFGVLLERHGFEICGEAGDPDLAREPILRIRPDLVMLDPAAGGGLALMRACAEADLPLLAVGLREDDAYVDQVLRAGAGGYLAKRDAAHQLLAAAEACLQGRPYLSPRVAGR